MLICYCMLLFTRFSQGNVEFQYVIGWGFLAILSVLLGVNIVKVIHGVIRTLWLHFRRFMINRTYEKKYDNLKEWMNIAREKKKESSLKRMNMKTIHANED